MKTYRGFREGGVAHVTVDGKLLDPRLDLENKSPTGLEWGYGGSGPAQLALALIADATGSDARALKHYQMFKWGVVGRLDQEKEWTMTDDDVRRALRKVGRR
jgi:hypothetical protein